MPPGHRIQTQLVAVIAALVGATITAGVLGRPASGACSGARWPVKTLADPGAAFVDHTATPTTVQQLRTAKPPAVIAKTPRQSHWETQTVSVPVELTNGKLVHDGDLQLVVHAPGQPAVTMIAELPGATCLQVGTSAADRAALTAARDEIVRGCGPFTTSKRPLQGRAVLTGVRFLDIPHKGDNVDDNARGAAPDEVEVHPIMLVAGLQCSAAGA